MLKIRALNRESSSDEDFPVIRREAQEEIALELYNKALRLQGTTDYVGAQKILSELIHENIPQLENNGGLPHSMSTLKYSCYVNIGNIFLKIDQHGQALDNYLIASDLDGTDVTLWYKIGNLAIKQNRFRQAAYAFARGLDCSESHWPCLDRIISLLYAMKDTINCLFYISKALILDKDYMKGLIIRRQLYQDNPAAEDYYKLYNPDYIWEPPLDIHLNPEDIEICLKDQKNLINQIKEVEDSLRPKPLQTIPLPKPLNDFTWLSLGTTVVYLHQYITDNEMSHFTMVDINKCMSQHVDENKEEIISMEPTNEKVVNEDDPEIITEIIDDNKMEIENESISERRPSQNSENNNNTDGHENTPIQTDNDEEIMMDPDGEEPDDNPEYKSDKCRTTNKGTKRKRDLLSDLQIWGWHSKRKYSKKGKSDKDLTVEDALNRIIPKNLLKTTICNERNNNPNEDSMNTMDLYNMYMEDRNINFLSPIHSPKSVNYEEYFATDREKNQVQELWTKTRDYCDSIVLIKDFVLSLSKLWHIQWPKELAQTYIDAYGMFREHYDIPQPLTNECTFDEMHHDALATLLYGELLVFSSVRGDARFIHVTAMAFLDLISGWHDDWREDYPTFFIRVQWLRAHIFRKENNYELAVKALELIRDVIVDVEKNTNEKFIVNLPNCLKCNLITNEITLKILKHLDMITSLSCIEDLYNAEKYTEVANILKLTFTITGNHPVYGRMGRPAQLAMLLHALWFTDLTDCFIWCEECLNETLIHFLKPTTDCDKWEKVIEKCISIMYEIIKMETVVIVDCLHEDKRARLVESLSKIICKQLNTEGVSRIPMGCITPWIVLYYVLVREEHRQQASKKTSHLKSDKIERDLDMQEADLPPSVGILISGHEFLGPKGWCLSGNGELLHFMLDNILDRLDTPILEGVRDKIDIHIEQALFCLYQHPSKKNKISRHLADHNVDPLSLTWERAFQLYDFYGPDCLPEFNSYKNASISADLEQLLQRIIALVPTENDPQPHVIKIMEYIQGKTTNLPEPIDFPQKVKAIYYLIGDYYFKDREFNRCIKYFLMDLCINPLRVDSWACIGLSYLSQLENKLNYCKKLKNESEFLDKAKCAQISFQKALSLAEDHLMLWIEFGSFEYMVHSFCSRLLKHESDTFSMEKFEYLENQKNGYLESAGHSFEKAIQLYQSDESEMDERWLQYYMLGKIAEKKQNEPQEYLNHYINASKMLYENNAIYPDKINYHNPQHLSVEALEMHYRINASVLKYLELHEGKEISNILGKIFRDSLTNSVTIQTGHERQIVPKEAKIETGETKNISPIADGDRQKKIVIESNPEQNLQNDVKKCLDYIIDRICDNGKESKETTTTQSSAALDVITIEDSNDDTLKQASIKIESEEIRTDRKPTNVQEVFDKMMEETMKKSEEPIDLDSDASDRNVNGNNPKIIVKTEDIKKADSEIEENIRTSIDDSSSTTSSSSSSNSSGSTDSDSDDDSSSTATSTSTSTITNGNLSNSEIITLIDQCINGLEDCVNRLPQNYKALYRLAHIYYNYKLKKDLIKSKQLLLSEYKCKNGKIISGLFSDRKPHNFFNGIWRIPSSEIDRPGSLSAHMSRCINLLLQVLRATNDTKLLLDLSIQFRKTPDPDKIYIKDSERLQFAEQALTMCVQCLRGQIKNLANSNSIHAIEKLLFEIYRFYQLVQKHMITKEMLFSTMLTDVYKKLRNNKIPENVNVLDLAIKYCQQNRLAEKHKQQQQQQHQQVQQLIPNQTFQPKPPTVTNVPVLPTPSTLPTYTTANLTASTLKRPTMTRPRGRPPLVKLPGQPRPQRGRSPNISPNLYASWQKNVFDQNATYAYLKRYQEELIKQYSQNLSLNQLTQLSQLLTQNQYSSMAQNALTNQYLASQSPTLMNPNLLSQLNLQLESGFGGFGDLSKMAGVSGVKTKKNLPHTITSSQAANLNKISTTTMSSTFTKTSTANLSSPKTKTTTFSPKIMDQGGSSLSSPTATRTTSSLTPKYVADLKPKHKSSQLFKEPTVTKIHGLDKTANILMKDRPNISITPVVSSIGGIDLTPTTYGLPQQTSPGKTLQEKLADKQKQHSVKHLSKNIEAEIIKKDNVGMLSVKKNLTISPTMSVTKSTTINKFPMDAGLSISQVPLPQLKMTDTFNLHQRKEISLSPLPRMKLPEGIHLTQKKDKLITTNASTNLQPILNVSKKIERKSSSDDDVICIE